MTESTSAATVRAVCYDEDGYVMTDQEVDEWVDAWNNADESHSPAPTEIAVVTGSAVPTIRNGDCAEKGPGSYRVLDVIAEWDLTMGAEADEVKPRWTMAKKIAEALNGT